MTTGTSHHQADRTSNAAAIPAVAYRRLRRLGRLRRGASVSSLGRAFHAMGAFALLVGLLLPLTDAGQALANPDMRETTTERRAQDDDSTLPAPSQVIAIGDFQNQIGCDDFDANCGTSQLFDFDGIWIGQSPVSPGSYTVQIVVVTSDGQQVTYGDESVTVDDDQAGIFYAFNAHTNEVTAAATDGMYVVQTNEGSFVPAPDGSDLTVLVPGVGGETTVQLFLGEEALGEPQSIEAPFGWIRVTFDNEGQVLDVEALPYGTLTVQRTDADGNPAAGACYQVRDGGDLVNQGCDLDDGADGQTSMTFPEGIDDGSFDLIEVQPPDGQDGVEDRQIDLAPGDNTVTVAPEGDAADDEGDGGEISPDDGEDPEQTAEPDQTPESDQTPEARDAQPGDLIVRLEDGDGNPIGGGCFQLIDGQGNVAAEACDTEDANPFNGNVGFFGVPAGEYSLRQSQTPEGSEPVDDRPVEVIAGEESNELVETTAQEAEPDTGDVVVLRQDNDGNPVGGACFEIRDGDGNVVAPQVCDEDGDVADDGRTGFFDVPVGSYQVVETRQPETVEAAQPADVDVPANDVAEVTVRSAAIAEEPEVTEEVIATEEPVQTPEVTEEPAQTPEATEEPAEPGDLIVTLLDQDENPIGGACFTLAREGEQSIESCDIEDANPFNGNTGFFGISAGEYRLEQTGVPEGTTPIEPQNVTVVGGEETVLTVRASVEAVEETPEVTEEPAQTPEATEEPVETPEATEEIIATEEPVETPAVTEEPAGDEPGEPGSLIVTFATVDGEPIGGACFELADGDTVVAEACDSDDPFPGNGRTGFFGVPSGDYELRMSQTPDGVAASNPQPVTVEPNQEIELTVNPGGAAAETPAVTEEPAETPEATEEAAETPEGQDDPALTGVRIDVSAFDQSGATICVELNTLGGIGLANPPAACDNGDGDLDPNPGSILLGDVPAGEYTLIFTDGPDEVFTLDLDPVVVTEFEVSTVTVAPPAAEPTPEPTAAPSPTPEPTAEPTPEPTPEPGAIQVSVTDPDGNLVVDPGTCVSVDGVTDQVCDNEAGDANGDPGIIRIDGVPAGTYDVTPDEAPETFVTAGAVEDVEVVEGEVVDETLVLAPAGPTVGTITISVLGPDDAAIPGGCFNVTNDSGTFEFCDDDNDGTIEIPDVVFGTQTVAQTSAAEGYAVDPEPQSADLSAEAPDADLTFRNELGAGSIVIESTNADGELIGGPCWSLSNDEDTFGSACDDDSNGATPNNGRVEFLDVPVGEWTLTQDTPPTGYLAVDERQITIAAGENAPLQISHEAAPITVRVTIQDTEGGVLAGACVALDGAEPLCDSDGDGILNFENVAPGEHRLEQTTAPEGYEPAPAQEITVEIGTPAEVVFVNDTPLAGAVAVSIVDAEGAPLVGVCASIGDGIAVCDNAPEDADPADGAILVEDVPPGDYTVTLTDLSEDYETPAGLPVTVESGATATADFAVANAAPETGDLSVSVVANSDEPLAGTCVVLSQDRSVVVGPVCDNGDGDTNDADGEFALTGIEEGTYTVSLDPASTEDIDGFQSAGSRSVTISAAQEGVVVIPVVVEGEPVAGVLEIVTRDNATGNRIGGACYALTGQADIIVCDGDAADENGTTGIIRVSDVPLGDYALTMSTTPGGYEPAAGFDIEIVPGVNRSDVRIDPLPQTGTLIVRPQDPSGNALTDTCFALQQGGATVATQCDAADTDINDGVLVFADLAAGTYQLVQTRTTSDEYAAASPVNVRIVAGEETGQIVVNGLNPGRVVVTKVSADDAGERLGGACFRLDGDRTYGPFCDDDDQNEDGRTIFSNIAPGDYTLVETVAPDGYVAAGVQDITVEPGSSQMVTVANELAPPPVETGALIVYKQDGNREELPGGCFRLFDGETPVTGQRCDNADGLNDGVIRFDDAPAGTWTLRETLAPSPSYALADDIEVTIRDGQTTDVSVVNTLKPGRVQVNVRNADGQLLQDACFDLASDGRGTRCSDAAGLVVFSGLVPGTYRLTETQAPYGYDPADPVAGIRVEPGQTTVVTIINARTPPPANTGSIQVQVFSCPAGDGGERTQFLGGADGTSQLSRTAGCEKDNAAFTLTLDDSTGGPGAFRSGSDGQYQTTVPQGVYRLTETNPQLGDSSSVGVRIYTGQQTTVIVINYLAPPEPEPATIDVSVFTCTPSFNGTLYEDFAQNCSADNQRTNTITVRAQGSVNAKGVTGDGGTRGQTTITGLTPGTYTIYEDRPYDIPTDYLFCGTDGEWPAEWKAVNGRLEIELGYGDRLTCHVFNIPEELTEDTGTILVRKYVCEIESPPKGYDYENECRLSNQGTSFDLRLLDSESGEYNEAVRQTANPDGLLRYTRLDPGTYQLREVDDTWCFAESNSVDSNGDVVVRANQLSEVWIYNCVDTTSPPNTGSGDAAAPIAVPGGDVSGLGVTLSLGWPVLAAGVWFAVRRRIQSPAVEPVRRAA